MVSEPLALEECALLTRGVSRAGRLVLWTGLAGAYAHVPQSTGHGYGSINVSPGHQCFGEPMWLGLHVKGRLRQQGQQSIPSRAVLAGTSLAWGTHSRLD